MAKQTKAERDGERDAALVGLERAIRNRGTVLYTITDYTKGSTDYVRVFVVRGGEIEEITWYVANAVDGNALRMTDRGIGLGGYGYSKALEVASAAWRVRFGESLPQRTNWRRL